MSDIEKLTEEEFRALNTRGPLTVTTNTLDSVASFNVAMEKIESELRGNAQRAIGDNTPPTIQ